MSDDDDDSLRFGDIAPEDKTKNNDPTFVEVMNAVIKVGLLLMIGFIIASIIGGI